MAKGNYRALTPGFIDPDNVTQWQKDQDKEAARRKRISDRWHSRQTLKERTRKTKQKYYRRIRAEAMKKGAITAKRTQLLMEKLEKKNFHVLDELINIFQKADSLPTLSEQLDLKEKIASRLMGYCFPKLRSTEVSGGEGNQTFINLTIPPPVNVTPKPKQVAEGVCVEIPPPDGT